MSKETGGPAFPVPIAGDSAGFVDGEECGAQTGMTLRDYFAAKAMQAWLSTYVDDATHPVHSGKTDAVAKISYELADAMIKAREA